MFGLGKEEYLASSKIYHNQCKICNKSFSHKHHYNNHKKVHDDEITTDKKRTFKCYMCNYECNLKTMLHEHFEQHHNIKLIIRNVFFFSNKEEFNHWKNNLEQTTCSLYINNHGSYKCANGNLKITYECHRSRFYIPKGTGKRHLKCQGSKKNDGVCPSQLNVTILKNGMYEVSFVETHAGHENDLGHINLTRNDRMQVAGKIASNIPFSYILN